MALPAVFAPAFLQAFAVQRFMLKSATPTLHPSAMPVKGKAKPKTLQPKVTAKGKAKAKAKANAKANTGATAVRKRPAQNAEENTAGTEAHIEEVTGETLVVPDSIEDDGPLDPQLGRKFRHALSKAPPEALATVRRVESLPVRSGKTTLWRQMHGLGH